MEKVRVVIAEEFQCYIEGYLAVLNSMLNVEVTNVFRNGKELIEYSCKNKNKIDFILLDIGMSNFDGTNVLEYFKAHNLEFKTIAVSEFYSESFYKRYRKKLALNGFISKHYFSEEHFQEAIKFISCGETYFVDKPDPLKYEDSFLKKRVKKVQFSDKEKEFIVLLSKYSFNQIAKKKGVSLSTVKTIISGAKEKLNVKNNSCLVKLFFRLMEK